eukprot:c6000_g1_i1.p1 GENE.c6000_g1_i1~~c6000_g1_i1.p1  ORF type:complete len:278 (+),score=76.93 c6000_g1_i1:30-836(+)
MSKIALVTGSNQGIGFEIARSLLEKGFRVLLTARNPQRGQDAITALNQAGLPNTEFYVMDISDENSVRVCAEQVKSAGHNRIDVLVNNAAIAFKSSDPTPFKEQARPTIHTNYFGTLFVINNFLPFLGQGSRIVNVASQAGRLAILSSSPTLTERFTSPTLAVAELDILLNTFVSEVESGTHSQSGWPNTCYGTSKLGLIALTRVLARDLAPSGINVTACCPGYCATNMSSYKGVRTPQKGAETPVWLATAPDVATGLFYLDCNPIAW